MVEETPKVLLSKYYLGSHAGLDMWYHLYIRPREHWGGAVSISSSSASLRPRVPLVLMPCHLSVYCLKHGKWLMEQKVLTSIAGRSRDEDSIIPGFRGALPISISHYHLCKPLLAALPSWWADMSKVQDKLREQLCQNLVLYMFQARAAHLASLIFPRYQ